MDTAYVKFVSVYTIYIYIYLIYTHIYTRTHRYMCMHVCARARAHVCVRARLCV